MVFYFSGTGNSQWVAKEIAKVQQEELMAIANASFEEEYSLMKEERLIFVFPIYNGNPPTLVSEFIKRVRFNHYENQLVTIIITYGYHLGNITNEIQKLFLKNNFRIDYLYTLSMPNNDVLTKCVDSEVIIRNKLKTAEMKLEQINQQLLKREQQEIVIETATYLSPFTIALRKWRQKPKSFFANDCCISCKICQKICPLNVISVEKKPVWKDECMKCLACLHYCPKSAIQLGNRMEHKARYTHPLVNWYQLNQE